MTAKQKYKELDTNRPLKKVMGEIIFEADTFWGKFFDVGLLIAIVISVLQSMLESVESFNALYFVELKYLEWVLTILFSIEYIARIYSSDKPLKYIFSWFGIIDFLSIIPTYIGLFVSGTQTLSIIRSIRLLRVFRVLKLTRYLNEFNTLGGALKASAAKITVFIGAVLITVTILGTLMYLIEDNEAGFTSIPRSIYWAIVTLTTVGYGDIAPVTWLGQLIASIIMLLGYGVIAIPTGIVSAEMASTKNENKKPTSKPANGKCNKVSVKKINFN